MIFAVDVYYRANLAIVAGVLFDRWDAAEPICELTAEITGVAEYEPGQFYKRELPCIVEILGRLEKLPDCIVVDGYVYLDEFHQPGLGQHLYDAIDGKAAVIGVAKTKFKAVPSSAEVFRGDSQKPLYVTAVGIDETEARKSIAQMHGNHRMPTLLKIVDARSRGLTSI